MPFLDYYKMILDRVSFYPELFVKEYRKAKRHLQPSDVDDLHRWMNERGFQVLLTDQVGERARTF
jgi:hypothetical protein